MPDSASGPVAGLPPMSGGGATSALESSNESSERSPRPPPASWTGGGGGGGGAGRGGGATAGGSSASESPGFVDSPRSGADGAGAARRRSSRATAGCSGSSERILSSAARASLMRWPSSAAMARWRATSNCGCAFFFCRAFSRICVASWLPGRTWSTCSAVAIAASKSRALKLSAARTSRRSVSAEVTRSCRVGVSATWASSLATSISLAGFFAFSISCRAGAKRGSIFRMKSHPMRQSSVLPSLNRFSVWRKVDRILSRTSRGSDGLPG